MRQVAVKDAIGFSMCFSIDTCIHINVNTCKMHRAMSVKFINYDFVLIKSLSLLFKTMLL